MKKPMFMQGLHCNYRVHLSLLSQVQGKQLRCAPPQKKNEEKLKNKQT